MVARDLLLGLWNLSVLILTVVDMFVCKASLESLLQLIYCRINPNRAAPLLPSHRNRASQAKSLFLSSQISNRPSVDHATPSEDTHTKSMTRKKKDSWNKREVHRYSLPGNPYLKPSRLRQVKCRNIISEGVFSLPSNYSLSSPCVRIFETRMLIQMRPTPSASRPFVISNVIATPAAYHARPNAWRCSSCPYRHYRILAQTFRSGSCHRIIFL